MEKKTGTLGLVHTTKLITGNVLSVKTHSRNASPYKCMFVPSVLSNRFSAVSVQPRSQTLTIYVVTWCNTSATSHSSADSARAPSLARPRWATISGLTQERSHSSAKSAGNRSANQRSLVGTRNLGRTVKEAIEARRIICLSRNYYRSAPHIYTVSVCRLCQL